MGREGAGAGQAQSAPDSLLAAARWEAALTAAAVTGQAESDHYQQQGCDNSAAKAAWAMPSVALHVCCTGIIRGCPNSERVVRQYSPNLLHMLARRGLGPGVQSCFWTMTADARSPEPGSRSHHQVSGSCVVALCALPTPSLHVRVCVHVGSMCMCLHMCQCMTCMCAHVHACHAVSAYVCSLCVCTTP